MSGLYGWVQFKSVPWWAGFGPLIAGAVHLVNHIHTLGLVGRLLDAGLGPTPPFALIYAGGLLLWANRKYWPHI